MTGPAMIFILARHELRRLFLSPLAWIILAVVQFILAWLFLSSVNNYFNIQSQLLGMGGEYGVTEVVAMPLLGNAAVVLLLVVPLISMRLITEERRNRTLPLLFSAPLSMTEIVLGKYLGLLSFLLIQLLLIALMPLSLLLGGGLDFGQLAAGLLGLALLLAGFAAVGLFMSTLTQHQTAAAVSTFGALLFFWLLDWARVGAGGGMLPYLSLLNHYEPFLKGVFDTRDLVFHLVFVTTFLALSVRRLDMDRLGG
jgi:ABC-2 type transport system permease protein